MTAYDNAGNFELTRRVIMYDAASSVTVRVDTYLRVMSTAAMSNYLWQQNLNSVVVEWTDRYINTVHHSNKWLNAVGSYVDLKSEYDDLAGDRNTSAVDNVQGISIRLISICHDVHSCMLTFIFWRYLVFIIYKVNVLYKLMLENVNDLCALILLTAT